MRITKNHLRRLIKEELRRVVNKRALNEEYSDEEWEAVEAKIRRVVSTMSKRLTHPWERDVLGQKGPDENPSLTVVITFKVDGGLKEPSIEFSDVVDTPPDALSRFEQGILNAVDDYEDSLPGVTLDDPVPIPLRFK